MNRIFVDKVRFPCHIFLKKAAKKAAGK